MKYLAIIFIIFTVQLGFSQPTENIETLTTSGTGKTLEETTCSE